MRSQLACWGEREAKTGFAWGPGAEVGRLRPGSAQRREWSWVRLLMDELTATGGEALIRPVDGAVGGLKQAGCQSPPRTGLGSGNHLPLFRAGWRKTPRPASTGLIRASPTIAVAPSHQQSDPDHRRWRAGSKAGPTSAPGPTRNRLRVRAHPTGQGDVSHSPTRPPAAGSRAAVSANTRQNRHPRRPCRRVITGAKLIVAGKAGVNHLAFRDA